MLDQNETPVQPGSYAGAISNSSADYSTTPRAFLERDAEAFLHALDPGEKAGFAFQTFDDSGHKRQDLARVLHGTLAQHRAELERLNSQGAGVFVMVNAGDGKGRSTRNVTGIRALFLDFDLGGEEGQRRLDAAMAATPQPSMAVESSPGKHHVYWLVADCPLNEFTRWQTALALRFNGDPSVKDLPRVMRLPGFIHRKGEPFTTRLIECTGELYTLDQVLQGLEAAKAAAAAPAAAGGAPAVLHRNSMLTSLAGSLRRKGIDEEKMAPALLALSAALYDDPLDAAEVRRIAKSVARYPAGEDWPEPEALPEALLPVPAFDMALLPGVLRPWIADISERMQCPPDFPAVGAMVSLAAVVGRRIGIRPKQLDDWTVVPNLWGAVVGRPGVLKTPALAEAMRPLVWLAAGAREAHARAMQEHTVTLELTKAHRDRLRAELRKKKPSERERSEATIAAELASLSGRDEEPVEVRYLTNDPTVEKLGELLAANPAGVLVFRDELTGWLRSLDREGRENDRTFYLEAWNGTCGYTYDRIGRGTMHIEAATVSVLGGIQPGPLAAYVREAAGDGRGADGLLQRFQLLVWPDDPTGWRNVDRIPDSSAKSAVFELFAQMANLDPLAVGGRDDDGLPYLRFNPEAQEAFDEWRRGLEIRLRSGEPEIIEAHMSKYRSLLPSLALLCHLADKPQGGAVTLPAMLRAAAWCEYLEAHARRLYAQGLRADYAAAHALASRIRRGDVPDGVRPRDIYRNGWAGLDKEATYCALNALDECGWLRVEEEPTGRAGGRPTVVIRLNPKLRAEKISTDSGRSELTKPSKPGSVSFGSTWGPVPLEIKSVPDVFKDRTQQHHRGGQGEDEPCFLCGGEGCGCCDQSEVGGQMQGNGHIAITTID